MQQQLSAAKCCKPRMVQGACVRSVLVACMACTAFHVIVASAAMDSATLHFEGDTCISRDVTIPVIGLASCQWIGGYSGVLAESKNSAASLQTPANQQCLTQSGLSLLLVHDTHYSNMCAPGLYIDF